MFYLRLRRFLEEKQAQDLIEYTLLMAFLALVSIGLMSQAGRGLRGIWGGAGTTIAVANGSVPGAAATSPPGGGGGEGGGNDNGGKKDGGDHDGR